MRTMLTAAFVAFLFVVPGSAQSTVTPEMRTAANDAYQKQDWKQAAVAYETIVKAEEKNAGANYRLGVSLLNLNDGAKAAKPLEAAMAISPNAVFALALARAHAKAGEKEKMYAVFEQSLALGGIAAESLKEEKDFAAVKSEPKFAEYVKKLDTLANPCRNKPEYRQFDFWVGEWLPKNAQGVTVGTSTIQLILNDCVILENWNTPVSSGKSFSNFDSNDGKWHQTWVTDKGGLTYYTGGMEGDRMVLVADTVANGKKTLLRMTFSKLESGDVRQHGESSTDEGKTWTTTYDFTYIRKK
ncbi:MAG TPA: hypothetical protein VFZ49_03115 [Pyrinomonadaceae bacterium]